VNKAGDLIVSIPCRDEKLEHAVCAALQDYAVIIMAADGTVQGWSEGAEIIFGYTASEMVGRPLAVLFTPEDQTQGAPAAELTGAARLGRAEDERWHVRKSGERIWVTGTVKALRADDGEVAGFVKIAREVTTKKFAELDRDAQIQREQQARVEAERQWSQFEHIFENLPAAIGLVRMPDQVYLFANRELREWAGARLLNGTPMAEAHPEVQSQLSPILGRAVQTGQQIFISDQHLLLQPGTEPRYFDVSFQPMRVPGLQQDAVLMFLWDVTPQVQGRLDLEKVNAELQAESERLNVEVSERQRAEEIARTQASTLAEQAALLDLAQDAIFALRMDSTITYWNRGAEQMYGWRRQEAVGRNIHELLRTEFPIPLKEIQNELVRTGQWFGEIKHHTRHGEMLNVLTSWALRTENEKPAGWLEIARDVTEMRRIEAQLWEKQKLESLGVLAGGVAHDFNNLLTGIMGNVSLAMDLGKSGADGSTILANALHASERAAYLTSQMLAYVGKGQFVVQSVDLATPVREAFRLVRGSIPDSVQVDFDFRPDLCCVQADPTQLQQVAMNLILNAVEALGEHGGKVFVRLATRDVDPAENEIRCDVGQLARGQYGVLEVQDTGPGIDPAILPKIFDPFFTTKFAGRGLGLASTAGIVRLLHGAICVQSEPGQGATFRVLLPLERPADEKAAGHMQAPILIVDDEEVVRQAASAILRNTGYEVALAENGRHAVDLFRQRDGRFALVLLDLTMPIRGGPQTIRELKQIRPEVPVIVSTGLTEEIAMQRFAGADIAGFIQKPYTLRVLVEKIRSVLNPC
jgi:PAS domain S-box-containing protein